MNKHLKEEKQKLQGTLQTIQQEMLNTEGKPSKHSAQKLTNRTDQLEHYKNGSHTISGAPLLGIKGQALIALLAFLIGYFLGWFLSSSDDVQVAIV